MEGIDGGRKWWELGKSGTLELPPLFSSSGYLRFDGFLLKPLAFQKAHGIIDGENADQFSARVHHPVIEGRAHSLHQIISHADAIGSLKTHQLTADRDFHRHSSLFEAFDKFFAPGGKRKPPSR